MPKDAPQDPSPDEPPRGGNLLALLVLVTLAALLLAGWRVFPQIAAYMSRQDCIATGHVNCGH